MNKDFGILILSCDKYSHLWPAFFQCWRKNFPNCPWPLYLGANLQEFKDPQVTTLLSGEDKDWSSSYLNILNQFPHKKMFVILEDLFLTSAISESKFLQIVEFMNSKDVNHIKYWPSPAPDSDGPEPWLATYEKGAPYRATVCGFWDRDTLKNLLIAGENPWNFEILGSYRTSYSDGYYGLREPLFSSVNMIEKGHWFPDAKAWALREGLDIGPGQKPTLQGGKNFISILQIVWFRMMMRVPWRNRLRLMNLLRKLFISY